MSCPVWSSSFNLFGLIIRYTEGISFYLHLIGKSWSATNTDLLIDCKVWNVQLTAGILRPTFALSSWEIITDISANIEANYLAYLIDTR